MHDQSINIIHKNRDNVAVAQAHIHFEKIKIKIQLSNRIGEMVTFSSLGLFQHSVS